MSKHSQQVALLSILVVVQIRTSNGNSKLLAYIEIQTVSAAPNKRGPLPAYVNDLVFLVGWVWLLRVPVMYAIFVQ